MIRVAAFHRDGNRALCDIRAGDRVLSASRECLLYLGKESATNDALLPKRKHVEDVSLK